MEKDYLKGTYELFVNDISQGYSGNLQDFSKLPIFIIFIIVIFKEIFSSVIQAVWNTKHNHWKRIDLIKRYAGCFLCGKRYEGGFFCKGVFFLTEFQVNVHLNEGFCSKGYPAEKDIFGFYSNFE